MIGSDPSQPMIQTRDPLQVGVGVAGACELIAMGTSQAMRSGDWYADGILQIDLSNAFYTVARQPMLESFFQRAPGMFRWMFN